jgi:hypothetical protein
MHASLTRKSADCAAAAALGPRASVVLAATLAIMACHAGPASKPARGQPADGAASTEGHRQLGAHVHGQGKLNIAVEDGRLEMELEVPAADIVGFEHSARTKQQRASVAKARAALSKPLALFRLPAAAGCRVASANVKHQVEGDAHGHGHDKDHDHGARRSGSSPQKGDAGRANHAEFHAEYRLTCRTPAALDAMTFDYFETFSGAQALEVNLISPKGQTRYQVTRDKPSIGLGGMM